MVVSETEDWRKKIREQYATEMKTYEDRRQDEWCDYSEPDRAMENHHSWKGGVKISSGYLYIRSFALKRVVKVANLVLEYKLGRKLQDGEIVHHKNEISTDDSPDNLEVKTTKDHRVLHNRETAINIVRSDNTTGVTGVIWDYSYGKFKGRIQVNGKRIFFGYFKTLEEARLARKQAEEKYWR